MDVARFFVYALLGADHDKSPYTQTGERIARLAAGGIRLVVDELRTDVTKTRKDGSRGRLRYDYGDHRDPQAAVAWLWKFVLCRAAGYAELPRLACSTAVGSGEGLGIIIAIAATRAAGQGRSVRRRCWPGRCGRAAASASLRW